MDKLTRAITGVQLITSTFTRLLTPLNHIKHATAIIHNADRYSAISCSRTLDTCT